VIPDVNVLVAAYRSDHPHHEVTRAWLEDALEACAAGSALELLPMVAAGFLRLVTNPRVFQQATPTAQAVAFLNALLAVPGVVMPELGREWRTFSQFCEQRTLKGNDIPDAWIASAVRSSGGHLVTLDRDFKRLLERAEWTLLATR
jgi:toxin-antitoxin system PIN domain toxin